MTKLLVSMGYQFEWLANDFFRLKFTNSGMINYQGEDVHLHQLIVSSGYYWDEIPKYNKMPLHERPCHATWGNGEELSNHEEKLILQTMKKFQINVKYEQGDIFVLDNVMTSHGRTPFTGARKIGVVLGDEITRK